MSEKGYSLLELCLVLFILSLSLVLTVPVVKTQLNHHQTEGVLNRISGDLYLASNEARSHQTMAILYIFESQQFYLLNVDGRQLKKVAMPEGYQIASNFSMDRVIFYEDGQVSQAGTISVMDRNRQVHQLIVQLSSGRFWIRHG